MSTQYFRIPTSTKKSKAKKKTPCTECGTMLDQLNKTTDPSVVLSKTNCKVCGSPGWAINSPVLTYGGVSKLHNLVSDGSATFKNVSVAVPPKVDTRPKRVVYLRCLCSDCKDARASGYPLDERIP